MMCLMSISCKTYDPTIVTSVTSATSTASAARATTLDSTAILLRDSIVYRERTIHDTVYITKEIFRDALNSKFLIQNSIKTDTIVRTDSIVQVIEQPPERYIPKFYKHCTIYFWCAIVLLLLYMRKAIRR
jgi:hypothetical protein